MRRITACILLVVVAHLGWNLHARRQLAREIEAARRGGGPASLADFFPAPTAADADNAALDLRAAYRAMSPRFPPNEAWKRLAEVEPPYRDDLRLAPPLSEDQLNCVGELVRVERRALRYVDDACRKPALEWPAEAPAAMVLFRTDDVRQQCRVAALLRIAALHEHATGERGEAIRRAGQLLFVSAALEKIPDDTAHAAALEICGTACDLLAAFAQLADGTGPADEERAQITMLLDESPLQGGWELALRARRAQDLETLDAVAEGRINSEYIGMPGPPWRVLRHLCKPMLRGDAALLGRLTGRVLDASHAPTWPGFLRRQPQMTTAVRHRFPLHVFACMAGSDESQLARRQYWTLARRRMTAVALALRWYAIEHGGRRPGCLQDLVPTYLPGVPRDPLAADNRPIGYVADDRRPIVYSVGDNGTDEGGSDLRPPHLGPGNLGAPEDAVLYLDARLPGEVRKEVWPYGVLPG